MALTDRVCIVTGAGRGIGRATCVRLASAGARVVAVARTPSDLQETAAACPPGRCFVHETDVTDLAAVTALIDRCTTESGRLDALINNAGYAPLCPMERMTDEQFAQTLAVNVNAVFLTCRAAWPLLKASKGCIVNISSMAADDPFTGFSVYGAAKAWVNTFTKAIADEGKRVGIRAFAVAPGAVETAMLRAAFPKLPAAQTLQPDDIAQVIEWLLEGQSIHASGAVIRVKK